MMQRNLKLIYCSFRAADPHHAALKQRSKHLKMSKINYEEQIKSIWSVSWRYAAEAVCGALIRADSAPVVWLVMMG